MPFRAIRFTNFPVLPKIASDVALRSSWATADSTFYAANFEHLLVVKNGRIRYSVENEHRTASRATVARGLCDRRAMLEMRPQPKAGARSHRLDDPPAVFSGSDSPRRPADWASAVQLAVICTPGWGTNFWHIWASETKLIPKESGDGEELNDIQGLMVRSGWNSRRLAEGRELAAAVSGRGLTTGSGANRIKRAYTPAQSINNAPRTNCRHYPRLGRTSSGSSSSPVRRLYDELKAG